MLILRQENDEWGGNLMEEFSITLSIASIMVLIYFIGYTIADKAE
jgi:hypothetical protein